MTGRAWLVRAARDTRLGVKNLLLHKLRSLLTMLGLVFGVGSVIAMLAIGEGASEEAIAQIRRLGSRNILLRAAKPSADQNASTGRAWLSIYGLLYEDAARIAETIPGVVRSEEGDGQGMQAPDARTDAYIPLTTARERHGDVFAKRTQGANIRELVELHQILVETEDESIVERTARAIERSLETFHRKKDYEVSVPLALLRQAQATRRTFSIVLGAIAGISLLVGGIGIMNIMLATVTERTREIGIRRAIGARRSQIVAQFLVEALVLSSVGGAIGIGLGLLIPRLVTLLAGMPTIVTAWSLLLAFGISVGVGVVFGLYPAVRASRLDPIVALRHE